MAIPPAKFIWFNGEHVPWDEARVHVLAHALHYGSAAFEGIRAYDTRGGPAVLGLDQHVRRFFRSCKIVELPLRFTQAEISKAILDTIRENGHSACYIRPLAFRGYGSMGVFPGENPVDVVIATFEWGAYHGQEALDKGVDVCVSSWRRMGPDTHPSMAKAAGNYLNSMLVVSEAKRLGFAEGIVLDVDGYVCEGSGENLFLVQDGVLYTAPVGSSILPGITRAFVIQLAQERGLEVKEQRVPREMLYTADELFFTGTAAEITPIRSVDGREVGEGRKGPITAGLQEDFFGIVRGEAEDRFGWLTPVS